MAVISLNRHCPLVPPLLIFFTETLCCQKTAPFHWLSAQCSTVRSGMSRRHFGKKKQFLRQGQPEGSVSEEKEERTNRNCGAKPTPGDRHQSLGTSWWHVRYKVFGQVQGEGAA